jgi:SAM-dependent methyltransferase
MVNELCVNCQSAMIPLDEWHAVCPGCKLFASNLSAGGGTGIEGLEELRQGNFEILLNYLEKVRVLTGLKVLEVGCSQGLFMESARARGLEIQGIEPENVMAEKAREKGLSVIDGFFPDVLSDGELFDIIIFNDVFEHLPDPKAALTACQKHLKQDGSLIINLPSSNGTFFKISKILSRIGLPGPYERLWQKGFPSPHIFYFNPNNLRTLVESTIGMQQVDELRLPSIRRKGTRARVGATYKGLTGVIITTGVLCLSFILPLLPSDICVIHFRRFDN